MDGMLLVTFGVVSQWSEISSCQSSISLACAFLAFHLENFFSLAFLILPL